MHAKCNKLCNYNEFLNTYEEKLMPSSRYRVGLFLFILLINRVLARFGNVSYHLHKSLCEAIFTNMLRL